MEKQKAEEPKFLRLLFRLPRLTSPHRTWPYQATAILARPRRAKPDIKPITEPYRRWGVEPQRRPSACALTRPCLTAPVQAPPCHTPPYHALPSLAISPLLSHTSGRESNPPYAPSRLCPCHATPHRAQPDLTLPNRTPPHLKPLRATCGKWNRTISKHQAPHFLHPYQTRPHHACPVRTSPGIACPHLARPRSTAPRLVICQTPLRRSATNRPNRGRQSHNPTCEPATVSQSSILDGLTIDGS